MKIIFKIKFNKLAIILIEFISLIKTSKTSIFEIFLYN